MSGSAPFGGGPFPAAGAGGGAAASAWTLLGSIEQGDGLALDPDGYASSAVYDPVTSRVTFVGAAHVTLRVGFQNPTCRWTKLLSALYPDFDYKTDVIDVGVDMVTWPHAAVELGFYFGFVDSLTVDASLQGCICSIRTAGASQEQLGFLTTTGNTPIQNLGVLVDETHGSFMFTFDGTNYSCMAYSRVLPEGTTRMQGGLAATSGTMRGANIADFRLMFGFFHGSTDSILGQTIAADLYVRRRRAATGPFP